MKKRLLCLLSALLLLMSLSACGGKDSAETADNGKSDFASFMEVQKNMETVKDMAFKLTAEASLPSNDGDYNLSLSGKGREVKKSADDIQMEVKYSQKAAGTETSGTLYIKDKAIYLEMMGQKMKIDTSSEMGSMVNADTSKLLAITKEMVSDLQVSQDGSDTVYKFTLDPVKGEDYFSKNVAGAEGISDTDKTTSFEKTNVTVIADKNQYLKQIDLDFAAKLELDGESTTLSYTATVECTDINTNLTIDFPDLSDYKETIV